MRVAAVLVVLVTLLAAGCGGAKNADRAKSRACLQQKGARITRKLDFVASTATDGAFVAHLPDNFVTLVFSDTGGDADAIQRGYERFAFPNVRKGLPDVLRRDRNVVMLWHEHPQDADLSLVTACLT